MAGEAQQSRWKLFNGSMVRAEKKRPCRAFGELGGNDIRRHSEFAVFRISSLPSHLWKNTEFDHVDFFPEG